MLIIHVVGDFVHNAAADEQFVSTGRQNWHRCHVSNPARSEQRLSFVQFEARLGIPRRCTYDSIVCANAAIAVNGDVPYAMRFRFVHDIALYKCWLTDWLLYLVEVHWLANLPIIGIGHLTIGIFVLVSKTTKMLLTAVHIDDNEVINDSVISHVSSSTFNRTK